MCGSVMALLPTRRRADNLAVRRHLGHLKESTMKSSALVRSNLWNLQFHVQFFPLHKAKMTSLAYRWIHSESFTVPAHLIHRNNLQIHFLASLVQTKTRDKAGDSFLLTRLISQENLLDCNKNLDLLPDLSLKVMTARKDLFWEGAERLQTRKNVCTVRQD